jgi:hypothetical protein
VEVQTFTLPLRIFALSNVSAIPAGPETQRIYAYILFQSFPGALIVQGCISQGPQHTSSRVVLLLLSTYTIHTSRHTLPQDDIHRFEIYGI